jgi:hypothetical protein
MSYAVKTGTTDAHWIHNAETPLGHVRYEGDLPIRPVWDAVLNNIREMTDPEFSAAELARLDTEAKDLLAGDDPVSKKEKAFAYLAQDTDNAISAKLNAVLTAIDGAASFGAMKTAIAAITDLPITTRLQMKNAIRAKIDAGEADG